MFSWWWFVGNKGISRDYIGILFSYSLLPTSKFRVSGLAFLVQGLGFRVQGLGFSDAPKSCKVCRGPENFQQFHTVQRPFFGGG